MQFIPLIRVNTLIPFITFLNNIGSPTEQLLEQVKLPIYVLDDPEALIPRHQALRFLEKSALREGLENLGLLVGQQTSLAKLGTFGRMLCQSLTLYDLFRTCIRIIPSNSSGVMYWLREEEEQVYFCQQYNNLILNNIEYAVHFSLMIILGLISISAEKQWQPQTIYLQSTKKNTLTKSKIFAQTDIKTGAGFSAVAFPRSFLSLPLPASFNFPREQQHQEHDKIWQSSAPAEDFLGSFRQALASLLRGDYPDINIAAEIAGMSVRTLQRRLALEGLTYSRIIEQTRFNKALCLLQEPNLKLIDITYELGYQDPAHFTRAFKRWTGVSPREFRTHGLKRR